MLSLADGMLYSAKPCHVPGVPLLDQGCSSFIEPRVSSLPLQDKVLAAKPKVVNAQGVMEASGDSTLLSVNRDEEGNPQGEVCSESCSSPPQVAPHKGNMRLLPSEQPGQMTCMSNKSPWLQDTEHDTAQGLAGKQATVLAAINMTLKRTKRQQPEGKLT